MEKHQLPSKEDYTGKQIRYFSVILKKMAKQEPLRIVCQGDSMTYGQDTNSPDRRPPKSDPTCEKESLYSYHEQAGKTYPEALQEFCHWIFGRGRVEIINRGYSGDWAELSRNRWKTNPKADLHLVMLGSNDSCTLDHVPRDIQQNISKYGKDMGTLIEQILDFGSAVVLLTPPKHANEEDEVRIAFREVVWALGKKYGIPVIDTTDFLISYPYLEVQSDEVHYNSKGYTLFAAKVAGILAGLSAVYRPYILRGNRIITPSLHQYGVTIRKGDFGSGSVYEESENAPFGRGSTDSAGLQFHLYSGTAVTLSFYSAEDYLLLIPLFYIAEEGGKLEFSLDLGMEPGRGDVDSILKGFMNENGSGWEMKPRLAFTGPLERKGIALNDQEAIRAGSFLLPRKGYYSVTMENPGSSPSVYFYGFLCLSLFRFC